ncbi:MAG: ATP-dependent helicase, partial [Turicibacter sp.]
GPTCVISCPGSGKTTVTVIRLANLIHSGGVNPRHILALTFSKASAADMNRRFAFLFPKLSKSVTFSTIHRFAFQIIKTYQQMMEIQYQFIDSSNNPTFQSKYVLSQFYLEITETYPSDDEIDVIKGQISLLKNLMIECHHESAIKKLIENDIDTFIQIYKKYESFKERNYLLDYDDLLTVAYQILKNNEQILSFYRQQYTHIQVDEAQDTSKVQFELIKLMLNEQQNLFLVGDDDQSIYAFRGAYPAQLLNFKETFKRGNIIYMSQNFRSSEDIVNTSSSFISLNKYRYPKQITTSNPKGKPITCLEVASEKEQLDYLVKQLNTLDDLSSVAILYRQNVSSIPLIESFERHKIPFKLAEGKLSFFTHPIVRDILAFYQLANYPRDLNAFKRLSKVLYLSASVVTQTTSQSEMGYLDFLTRQITFQKAFQRDKIRSFKEKLPNLNKTSPSQSISYILDTLDYRGYLTKRGFLKEEDGSSYSQGLAVIETLRMIARSEETIEGFLNRLSHLQQISDHGTSQTDAISLMTFHASKGLEFDTVFMIDCMNGITPPHPILKEYQNDELTAYEEEARLFYVALTRAKTRVELISVSFKHATAFTASNFFEAVNQLVNPKVESSETAPSKKLSRSLSDLRQGLISAIDLSPFKVGTLIIHKIFGEGKISHLEGEIATIEFSENTRRISLRITLQNETLSLAPPQ